MSWDKTIHLVLKTKKKVTFTKTNMHWKDSDLHILSHDQANVFFQSKTIVQIFYQCNLVTVSIP